MINNAGNGKPEDCIFVYVSGVQWHRLSERDGKKQ